MKIKKDFKKILITISIVILAFTVCGCKENISEYSQTGFAFDTVIGITIYDINKNHAENVLNECISKCNYFDSLFSITNAESEIYKINHAEGNAVKVSDETLDIINKSVLYSEKSNGLFDITIGPLYDLWDFNESNHKSLPDAAKINVAVNNLNYKKISIDIDSKTICIPKDYKLNLGGIAKGYIADYLKDYILSQNIDSAIINLGGNILTIGSKPNGENYNIGIQKPFSSSGEILTSVSVTNKSVVTSGTYQRYFVYDEKIYHHIINPKTGYPVDNGLSSVTIISDSSTDADAYSTICMLLGYEKGLKFINSQNNISAIFIDNNGNIIQ